LAWHPRAPALACAILLVARGLSFAADPYAGLPQLKFGQPNPALVAIQSEIAAANPGQLRAVEARLIEIVQSPEATPDAKSWVCRTLRIAGSEQAVPALAALLTDPQLAADAQFALRSIPGARADQALRAALPKTQGLLAAGVIQTLGARGDRQAVPLIAPLAGDADPVVAEAALYALGHIGGVEALKAVQQAKVGDGLQRYRQHAILLCAEGLLGTGNASEAMSACRALYRQSPDPVIRSGALRAMVLAEGAAAGPVLAEALSSAQRGHVEAIISFATAGVLAEALSSAQRGLRAAAARLLCESAPDQVVSAVLANFNAWTPETQGSVLGLLTNASALPTVRAAAQGANEEVGAAALEALGRLGEASDIPLLLGAAVAGGRAQGAARLGLQSLRGQNVNPVLVAAMKSGPLQGRCEAMRAVAARHHTAAVPLFFELAADSDPAVRSEAQKALGQLAASSELPRLLNLLVQARSTPEREGLEDAAASLIRRAKDQEAATAALQASLSGKSGEIKCALLRLGARIPGPKSLDALRAALADAEPAVQDTAVRCLAEWPDTAATPDLLRLARSASSQAQRTLALRGFIRLAGLEAQRAPAPAVKLLGEALGLAASVDDKRAVLAALMEISHVTALDLAGNCLADPALEVEAANTVVQLARKLQAADAQAAGAAVQRILDTCKSPAARQLAETAGVPLPKKAPFKVLVFSKTLGFRHANIPLGIAAIRQLGAEHGFAVEATEESSAFTPENLARYKTVIFLSATGDVLNQGQEQAFKEYVLGGGGFVGIHGALFGPSACEDKWAWYGDLCCVSFKNHSAVVPARVEVEDRSNPSTSELPEQWLRSDEWYNYEGTPRGRARVLATVEESTYQGGTVGPDHPIAWCKQMGKGIMWYTAMGHTEESFREPLFLKHILGGIQLTAGGKPADLTPNQKPLRRRTD
jgi:type 1 glutamine amidotransferase/HEAT repeat protein